MNLRIRELQGVLVILQLHQNLSLPAVLRDQGCRYHHLILFAHHHQALLDRRHSQILPSALFFQGDLECRLSQMGHLIQDFHVFLRFRRVHHLPGGLELLSPP